MKVFLKWTILAVLMGILDGRTGLYASQIIRFSTAFEIGDRLEEESQTKTQPLFDISRVP